MQVILDSLFARPGSAPIGGGKKGEFRGWAKEDREPVSGGETTLVGELSGLSR